MKAPVRITGESEEEYEARLVHFGAKQRTIALGKKRFNKRIFLKESELGRKFTPSEKVALLRQWIMTDTAQLRDMEGRAKAMKGEDEVLFRDLYKHREPDLRALEMFRDSIEGGESEELPAETEAVEPIDEGFFTDEL